jgi:hypothetical protein
MAKKESKKGSKDQGVREKVARRPDTGRLAGRTGKEKGFLPFKLPEWNA